MKRICPALIVLSTLVFCRGSAEIRPAAIFTDYAVLQRGEPVRVWGTAAPAEAVSVSFADQKVRTVADSQGTWMVILQAMPACAEGRNLIFEGSKTEAPVQLKEILVGEVWLAGGQSNMATTMGFYGNTTKVDIEHSSDPLLRMITVPDNFYEGHNQDRLRWESSDSASAVKFSACAYYFAKNLRSSLNVPVGIISCAVNGSVAEAWMSRKTLESSPDLKRIVDAYDRICHKNFENEGAVPVYYQEYERAKDEFNRKKAAKESPNPRPVEKVGPRFRNRPCGLYENMLIQVIPYTVKGVIWYQGETNAIGQNGFFYRTVFSALIREWRDDFMKPELPFLFVQLATLARPDNTTSWPELRESQLWVNDHVKHTGMVVLADGGDETDIHPHSKDKAGLRLSLLARNLVYGDTNLVCNGPRLQRVERGDGKLTLFFNGQGAGLVLQPSGPLRAFQLCGPDGKYFPAQAELAEGKIIVSSEKIASPEHVRYGWNIWFVPELFNIEGLPASPFRTDDFPPFTKGRFYLDDK